MVTKYLVSAKIYLLTKSPLESPKSHHKYFLSLCLFHCVCFPAVNKIWLYPTQIIFKCLIKKPYLSSDMCEKKLGLTDVMQLLHCYIDDLNQHAVVFSKEVQMVYRLFLVNCYLLHVPRLPSQACRPWVCRVCHGTPRFWQISQPYFNQGGQIMPT